MSAVLPTCPLVRGPGGDGLRVAEPSAKYIVERETPLVRGFELLATSAGAIVKLRELILSLAVQGGLVPQESKDSSAELLFTQIRMEINGQAKPSDADPPLIAEPFALPSTWKWTQLGEVVEVIRGITFPASEKTREPAPNRIACLRTTNVQQSIEWEDLLFVDRSFMGREDQLIRHHDIVMSMANSRELVGKVALIEHVPHPEATFGGFLGVLRTHRVEPRYVMAVLRTRYARTALIGSASQTTNIANISLGKLRPLPFPLPPLAEQLRIVARVEELMKLCDALEQSGRLADEQHARLTSTLFDALAASGSAHALAENWQRIAEHFDLLLDRPEAIAAFEQTILQLAVRGLLVPQLVSDGPARSAWLGADAAEAPYEVPLGWEWRSVESIAKVGTGTTPSRTNAHYFDPPEVAWVTSGETGQPFIAMTAQAVSGLALRETSLKVYPVGALIVAMYGQGKTRGQIAELVIPATTNQACAAIVPIEPAVHHRRYIKLFFEKSYDELRAESAGGAQPNLNLGKIKSTLIPLPPLAEQHRIVARVEELRRLCAQLREQLTEARRTQSQLADALVAAVVA